MFHCLQPLLWRLHYLDVALSSRIALTSEQKRFEAPHYWPALIGAHLGDSWFWALVIGGMISRAYLEPAGDTPSDLHHILSWFASIVAATFVTMLVKRWCKRSRPGSGDLLYGGGADIYSFPSGHAVRMGVIVAWSNLLWGNYAWLAWLLALWVGWSRVRLGIHYASDVLAGYALGAGLALLIK